MKKPTKTTQTAWVIEGSPGRYLGRGMGVSFDWVERVRAFHLARREHAEALLLSVRECFHTTDDSAYNFPIGIDSATVREVDL